METTRRAGDGKKFLAMGLLAILSIYGAGFLYMSWLCVWMMLRQPGPTLTLWYPKLLQYGALTVLLGLAWVATLYWVLRQWDREKVEENPRP